MQSVFLARILLSIVFTLGITSVAHGAIHHTASSDVTYPRLLGRAKKVADARTWDEFRWLTSTDILIVRNPTQFSWKLSRFNLKTGRETNLTALNGLLKDSFVMHGHFEASPDGKRLLWNTEATGMRTAKLDGSDLREWPGDWHRDEIHWMSDSKHWLMLDGAYGESDKFIRAIIYNVNAPHERIVRKLSGAYPIVRTLDDAVFVTSTNRLLVDTTNAEPSNKVKITECNLPPAPARVRKIAIPLPIDTDVVTRSYTFSRHGDHIAWFSTNNTHKPTISLWTARIDGTGRRCIGQCPLITDQFGQPMPPEFQWLPDGKALGFKYNGGLWLVSTK